MERQEISSRSLKESREFWSDTLFDLSVMACFLSVVSLGVVVTTTGLPVVFFLLSALATGATAATAGFLYHYPPEILEAKNTEFSITEKQKSQKNASISITKEPDPTLLDETPKNWQNYVAARTATRVKVREV